MADKRSIRLKEMMPNVDRMSAPLPSYRTGSDDTLDAGPFKVRTDHNGFIQTGNGDRDILEPLTFLGDSFVESMYSTESTRFVSGVERGLDDAGHRYKCLNGGYSGASSLQLVNVLLNKIYPLVGNGRTVVFFGPQSDYHIYGAPATYWHPTERYAPILPPLEPEATDMVRGFEITKRMLKIAVEVSKQLNIRLIFATSPFRSAPLGDDSWLQGHLPGEVYTTVQARRGLYTEKVREAARETGTPLLDGEAALRGQHHLFYDELHLNEKGQAEFTPWLTGELAKIL